MVIKFIPPGPDVWSAGYLSPVSSRDKFLRRPTGMLREGWRGEQTQENLPILLRHIPTRGGPPYFQHWSKITQNFPAKREHHGNPLHNDR
jgi:hypothetical protein